MRVDYLINHPALVAAVAEWRFQEWGLPSPHGFLNSLLPPGIRRTMVTWGLQHELGRRRIPTALIAFAEEEPVGAVSLVGWGIRSRPELSPWLAGLVVVPRHWGRGIGSALIAQAVQEAKSLGVSRVFLHALNADFYAHRGWTVVGPTTHLGRRVVIMSRETGVKVIEVICEDCGLRNTFGRYQSGRVQTCRQCGAFLDVEGPPGREETRGGMSGTIWD